MVIDKQAQLETVLINLSESEKPNYDELTRLIKSYHKNTSGIGLVFQDESLTELIKSAIKRSDTRTLIKELKVMLDKSVKSTKHFSELTIDTSSKLDIPIGKLFTKTMGSKLMGFSITKCINSDDYLVKSFSIDGDIQNFSNWHKNSTRIMSAESVSDLFNN